MSTHSTVQEPWRPLSVREATDGAEAYDALHSGVPDWLRSSLWEWIKGTVSDTRGRVVVSLLRDMERRLRFSTPWDGYNEWEGLRILEGLLHDHEKLMLNVTDFLVARLDPGLAYHAQDLADVDQMLTDAGSAYRVALKARPPRLVRRVDSTLELAAARLMDGNGSPGKLLADAWQATYGLHPNPSHGYRQGVRAVEAAAIPVVLPSDSNATLGKVITSLRQGAHKWQLSLTHRANAQRPVEVLVADLALLWEGQYDRHVTEGKALQVTQAEAETALPLAVTLVQRFTTGCVSRRAQTPVAGTTVSP